MPEIEKACLFNSSKECPARKAVPRDWDLASLAKIVCPICPIRLKMLEGKASFGEM